MPNPKVPANEFIELIQTHGIRETGRRLGTSASNVCGRRKRLEAALGRPVVAKTHSHHSGTRRELDVPERTGFELKNGVVLIGSDPHYWPGIVTTAHRGFVRLIKELKPHTVIMNGDVLDGSTISRHTPIGWEERPTLIQEIEACHERLAEIVEVSGKARRYWPLGNHDARFETRLAIHVPEYAKVKGVHLQDHFPGWEPCWSCWINDNVVVKHRFRGGIHATHNNVMWSGVSIFTGHLHSLQVRPHTDYTGTRYGVDTGTLAEPRGPQFRDYTEENPTNWRGGFVVATFHNGRLLWPEIAHVIGPDEIEFRGEVIKV